ncbi:HEPN domain-containing protein [Oceanibaculum nanhaiense]|uniref:HEPN domain-containing protein n=1 Tax=Oceanibaculum nanhaiense TaxID=1909734 RepID=UPI003D2A06FE
MIDLHFVDELIAARRVQHGGGRGAPRIVGNGQRIGASINRSCIVMLSALLQAHVDSVFRQCAPTVFPEFSRSGDAYDAFLEAARKAGNPNPSNIKSLFRRIGVPDVMDGLAWRRGRSHNVSNATIVSSLDEINQVRNRIAHSQPLTLNGAPYQLNLVDVTRLRNVVEGFGEHFEAHALAKIAASKI